MDERLDSIELELKFLKEQLQETIKQVRNMGEFLMGYIKNGEEVGAPVPCIDQTGPPMMPSKE